MTFMPAIVVVCNPFGKLEHSWHSHRWHIENGLSEAMQRSGE
jgi:hypothetical protein